MYQLDTKFTDYNTISHFINYVNTGEYWHGNKLWILTGKHIIMINPFFRSPVLSCKSIIVTKTLVGLNLWMKAQRQVMLSNFLYEFKRQDLKFIFNKHLNLVESWYFLTSNEIKIFTNLPSLKLTTKTGNHQSW